MPMRTLKIFFLFVVLLPPAANSQEKARIDEIKDLFSAWQPIIKAEIKKAPAVYLYTWGENYENMEWTTRELKSDQKQLSEKNSIIRNKLGSYVLREVYSYSGDWLVISESYYDTNGNLFFVFWKMNTFQAEEPATIEKRLYFNVSGKILRSLREIYKLNTKQRQNISFTDRDVDYELEFKNLAFYDYLPKIP